MLDREKRGQHVAVEHRRYCEHHPDPCYKTDVREHFFGAMTFVSDEFAGDVPDTGREECSCGGRIESEVSVLSWPPTPMTGEAIVSYLAKTNGKFAIETSSFGYEASPEDAADWENILPIRPVPNLSECLQVMVVDGYLLTANSYMGDPVGLGNSPELAVSTLGTICRQLPTAPISMKNCELDSLLWEVHDGYDVYQSSNVVADVSDIIDSAEDGGCDE